MANVADDSDDVAGKNEELQKVISELKEVEQQIENLMTRRHKLQKRKGRLEKSLKSETGIDIKTWGKTDFSWSSKLDELRNSLFKLQDYRPLQLQAMNASLSGRDCIVIMPTGGGKSLCFQLPAFVLNGFTLVVSPLVSLMEDQVMSLRRLGITQAYLLCASTTPDELKTIQEAMMSSSQSLKLLYVTPEKLAKSKRFMSKLEKVFTAGRLDRIVIDEVHCCSQWGHDFRPDYKFLGVMKRQFPKVPILGLTATATNDVIDDVVKMLGIQGALVFRAPLNRANLFYEVHNKPSDMNSAMDKIYEIISQRFPGQSGIIYCLSQKDTEEVANELAKRGLAASCYHANMDARVRSKVHSRWSSNELQVVVATIAFGMGIDKSDVRFVIHHSISKSMENYYQESGRAGRDDAVAHCLLFASFGDVFRHSTMVFTEQTGLDKLYAMAGYAFDLTSCRRKLIAKHFGERWTQVECNSMCDHCKNAQLMQTAVQDITTHARQLIAILSNAKARDQRMTALKLLDAWSGRGSTALRVAGATSPPGMDRMDAERVLMRLLLDGYLREEFHFTPYNTISYIVPGECSGLLDGADHKITMELHVLQTRGMSCNGTAPTLASKSPLCKDTTSTKSTGKGGGEGSKNKINPEQTVVNQKKKRKLPVVYDDSGDEDFQKLPHISDSPVVIDDDDGQ